MPEMILAVDLGGTKAAAALVQTDGKIVARRVEPTNQEGPAQGITQIRRLIDDCLSQAALELSALKGVGIGIPAVLAEDDTVIWAPNLADWKQVPLRTLLEQELGCPVYLEYDGHTAVLGEWWMGANQGCRSLVDVIIGTGIGGGLILDERLVRGANRLAGAAGWFALTTDARQMDERVRSLGFWEAMAAGPGFARWAQTQAAQEPLITCPAGPLWKTPIEAWSAKTIFAAARQGDETATGFTSQLAQWLGLGLANIISLLNPEVVILGGGLGSQVDFLLPEIRAVVERWAQPIAAHSVQIQVSTLGADAGIYGAAYTVLMRQSGPATLSR